MEQNFKASTYKQYVFYTRHREVKAEYNNTEKIIINEEYEITKKVQDGETKEQLLQNAN